MNNRSAFTLVELLVIIAIIGILSSFIFIQTNNAVNSGKDSKRKSDVALLASGIHVYSIGSDLIESSGCRINVDCPSTVNQALLDQIGPLPSDPDSNKAYIYESDGTDCTISSVLSDGQTYQYDCSDDAMTQSEPVNGICGSSGGAGSYTIPTTNFCSDGYIPTVSGAGPWEWDCPDSYLGSPTHCTGYKSVDGQCDATTDGSNTYTAPATDLCTTGDATSVSSGTNPAGYFTWACNGQHGGIPDSCSANLKVDGVCTTGLIYLSTPSSGSCNEGNSTAVTGSGPWYWNCAGLNEGTTETGCIANVTSATCGSAASTHPYESTNWISSEFCSLGAQSPSTISFPGPASTANWTCTLGSSVVNCSAHHTGVWCSQAGMEMYGVCYCMISGSAFGSGCHWVCPYSYYNSSTDSQWYCCYWLNNC
ncbi:MAG: type II secretion system protein [Candidatus Paceibacterota bacterium]